MGFFDGWDDDPEPTSAPSRPDAPVDGVGAPGVGAELRAARERAGLSLRRVAEQIGVSRGYLSKAENGHVVPSWEVLVRIAAAYGREPRLRLLPVHGDLEARARAMVTKTPQQRLSGHARDADGVLDRLVESRVSFVVAGAAAAVLQGLPMTVDVLRVLVLDDDENLAAVVDMLLRVHVLFREFDAEEMRAACQRPWLVGWCEVQFDLVGELPEAAELEVGGVTVPVVPLTMLVAADRDVADVFRAVQSALAG